MMMSMMLSMTRMMMMMKDDVDDDEGDHYLHLPELLQSLNRIHFKRQKYIFLSLLLF